MRLIFFQLVLRIHSTERFYSHSNITTQSEFECHWKRILWYSADFFGDFCGRFVILWFLYYIYFYLYIVYIYYYIVPIILYSHIFILIHYCIFLICRFFLHWKFLCAFIPEFFLFLGSKFHMNKSFCYFIKHNFLTQLKNLKINIKKL